MKKKLIIYFSKLSIGGMEKSLIEFLKNSHLKDNYDITLYLGYVIENAYLEEALRYADVKVVCKGKWNLFGKIKTYISMQLRALKYRFKGPNYDCAICYTHHHKILAKLTRLSSKNNIIFVHTDLVKSRDQKTLTKLMNDLKFEKFKKIVCVSETALNSFLELRPECKDKVYIINNYINGENVIEKAKEEVDDYEFKGITFINMSRHSEVNKQVSFLIEAAKRLNVENYKFNVLLVGDGVNHNDYLKLIEKYELKNVKAIGSRLNPYKYLKRSSALVLASKYEGYGMVLDEARALNVPIITTDAGNGETIANEGYGILVDSTIDGIYSGMKHFLDKGFKAKKFDYVSFNNKITEAIDMVVKE